MKTLNAANAAHLALESTTVAVCWQITKRDGTRITGTDHDVDIIILSGDYVDVYPAGSSIVASDNRSTSDSSVDNMEVKGAFQSNEALVLTDVNVADIESGNLSGASVVQFLCDWRTPNDWQLVMRSGTLGEIKRDSDGGYTTELRGIKQQLKQVFVETYSQKCLIKRFGDERCAFDLTLVTASGSVTAVTSKKRFNVSTSGGASPSPALGAYRGGEFTFLTGRNTGFMREIKRDDMEDVHGQMLFWEGFPYAPEVGDTFTMSEGCDRTWARCKQLGNELNFRGYGILIEGSDALMRGPT
jgi:uncharacterized phage protein (TIGR02218 family)